MNLIICASQNPNFAYKNVYYNSDNSSIIFIIIIIIIIIGKANNKMKEFEKKGGGVTLPAILPPQLQSHPWGVLPPALLRRIRVWGWLPTPCAHTFVFDLSFPCGASFSTAACWELGV